MENSVSLYSYRFDLRPDDVDEEEETELEEVAGMTTASRRKHPFAFTLKTC